MFNPDFRTVNNTGAFNALADAVFYNALAWAINGSSQYATNVASWINTWSLANNTCMAKIVSSVLVLRGGNASPWTC